MLMEQLDKIANLLKKNSGAAKHDFLIQILRDACAPLARLNRSTDSEMVDEINRMSSTQIVSSMKSFENIDKMTPEQILEIIISSSKSGEPNLVSKSAYTLNKIVF